MYILSNRKGGTFMDNLCNCHDCERSYRNCIENLDLKQYKIDIVMYCSTCCNPSCLGHQVYMYLSTHFPGNKFTKEYLLDPEKFPKHLRPGICNYMAEKYYVE